LECEYHDLYYLNKKLFVQISVMELVYWIFTNLFWSASRAFPCSRGAYML